MGILIAVCFLYSEPSQARPTPTNPHRHAQGNTEMPTFSRSPRCEDPPRALTWLRRPRGHLPGSQVPWLGLFLVSFPNPCWILLSGLWSSLHLGFTAFVCKIKVLASLVEVHVQEGVVGYEPQNQGMLACLARANSLPCSWVQKGRAVPQSLSRHGRAGSHSPPEPLPLLRTALRRQVFFPSQDHLRKVRTLFLVFPNTNERGVPTWGCGRPI